MQRPRVRSIASIGSSGHRARTPCGGLTLPASRRGLASSMSPLSSTPLPGASPGSGFARPRTGSGVACSRTAPAGFVLDPLEQALHERRPVRGGGLVHHSDRGVPYVSIKYTERLAAAGIAPSVGSVGDSYDNALAETINGLYKTEVIHRRGPWRSFEAVEFATLEWVDWFNHRRLLEPIGNIPSAEAEKRYYASLEQPALAA